MSLIPELRAVPVETGDAFTYLIPARNIVEHGAFSREPAPPFVREPHRTPGYPLLIAAVIGAFGDFRWTLFVAALTAGCAAWCAVTMTREIGGNPLAQHAAGLIAAFLPNSPGLSAQLLTDAIAGHLTLVWLFLLVTGCTAGSLIRLGGSAVVLLLLQSLKPTFSIAGLLAVVAALLFASGKKRYLIAAALACVSIPLPAYFAEQNHRAHGVRSVSLLGIETVREYLHVRFLEEHSGEDMTSLTRKVREEDRAEAAALTEPSSPYGRLYMVKDEKVKEFLREHPLAALRLMITEMARQFAAPQEFFPQVFTGELPPWGRMIGSLLTLVFWGCAFLGAYMLWKNGNRQAGMMLMCVLAFFLVTGSVSHFVGARLRFPADMAAIPFAGIGCVALSRFRQSFLKK